MEEEENKSRELYDQMESMMNDSQMANEIREKASKKAELDEIIHIANLPAFEMVDEADGN